MAAFQSTAAAVSKIISLSVMKKLEIGITQIIKIKTIYVRKLLLKYFLLEHFFLKFVFEKSNLFS